MGSRALLLAARSVPRALKLTGVVSGVLFGLSGGLAAAALIMASDVENAYDRVTRATDGFDAVVYSEEPVDSPANRLRTVDGIEDAADGAIFEVAAVTVGDEPVALGPSADDPCYTGAGDVSATVHTQGWRGRAPEMLLSEGRFPLADAREVVLPSITAGRLDLGVGDHIVFAGDCGDEAMFDQPIDVRISGLGTGVLDGPSVGANLSFENLLISPLLAGELADRGMEPDRATLVWLEDGIRPSELSGLPEGSSLIIDMVELREAVRGDLRPDATALRVFAVIAALSAVVILGPMLARLVRSGNAAAPTLRSLGMTQRSLLAIGLSRGAALGLVVASVTAGATVALAGWLPIGAARHFQGALSFSPGASRAAVSALLAGAAALAIMGTVTWATVRRRRSAGSHGAPRRPSRILATVPLRPEWGAGVRFALQPGSLDDPTPVRSGLTTAAIAVAAVVGVLTFSSSLDHLRDTPRLYGANWDVFALVEDVDAMATALEGDPEVERLARGTFFPPQFATLGDDGAEVYLMSFEAGPGRAEPTVVSGRAPEADHEVMLTRELSGTLDAGIDDVVSLHLPSPESLLAGSLEQPWDGPQERVTDLEVVGIGVLPIGDGRLGVGASMTFDGLQKAVGVTTSPELRRMVAAAPLELLARVLGLENDAEMTAGERAAIEDDVLSYLIEPLEAQMVVFDAGGPEQAARKAIAASGGSLSEADFARELTPEGLVNLDLSQASRIPDSFAGLMAVIAVAVVSVLVASGGKQRREALAILGAVGFGPRQVRKALVAQAVTTVLAASLLAPVGVAVGRLAWLSYAEGLGVAPEALVSPRDIVIAIGSLLVVALAVAVIASHFHARRSLGTLLRPQE